MNDRLQNEFIAAAALAPSGQRMYALIAMVAEHCATICDIEAEGDKRQNSGASHASKTIRAAFIGRPELNMVKPIAQAAAVFASIQAAGRLIDAQSVPSNDRMTA